MATPDSALTELSTMLLATDASLSSSLGEILATAIQELVEAELTARIGAEHGERTPMRVTQRNGHRLTSTRKVDDLVKALGCDSGVSKSSVSRICQAIDVDVAVL